MITVLAYFISMKGLKKKLESGKQDSKELLKVIGKRLAKKRKELGYNNSDDFAYESGLNRSQYGKYEAGSQDIRITTLIKILRVLEMSIEELFKDLL